MMKLSEMRKLVKESSTDGDLICRASVGSCPSEWSKGETKRVIRVNIDFYSKNEDRRVSASGFLEVWDVDDFRKGE